MSAMNFREPNQVLWRGMRPGHNGTQIVKEAYVNNTAVNIHTVGTGKILHLCTASININVAGAGSVLMYVRDSGFVAKYRLLQYFVVADVALLTNPIYFWPPLEIPAAWMVTFSSSPAGCGARGLVFGWEE